MLSLILSQIALAAATALSTSGGGGVQPADPIPPQGAERVVAADPRDKTALDILNDTRPDILGRGASRRCPPVTAVYVDGARRVAPAIGHGFSRATLYFAGDTVMIMLPPSVADALRTVPAKSVRAIRYVDCRADTSSGEERDTIHITTQ